MNLAKLKGKDSKHDRDYQKSYQQSPIFGLLRSN